MAILVIQLARFGDIFQTRPALSALRRRFPGEDVHLLVRERFAAAAHATCDAKIRIHALPSAEILAAVCEDGEAGVERSLEKMNAFVAGLRQTSFSHIINLSFSPFSSYLTEALTENNTVVSGYTRHADGYLNIPDDSSAYFYAQVGIGRHNRYHLTEIFAAVAGVDLIPQDFTLGFSPKRNGTVVIHLGASQAEKAYPPELWREVLNGLQGRIGKLILVGSADERAMAVKVAEDLPPHLVSNQVGESSIEDLVRWVAEAELVIGADSAPVHIAALTGTPVLNLSCAAVNFWETGPVSAGSRVLFAPEMHLITPAQIINEAVAMDQKREGAAFAVRMGVMSGFKLTHDIDQYYWPLLQALYTAADYPKLPSHASPLGFQRLFEISTLALAQLERMKPGVHDAQAIQILQSIDEMLTQIPELDPLVKPVVAWFQTERLRMGPAAAAAILARTKQLFEQLGWISAVYHRPGSIAELCERAADLARGCAPLFREFKAHEANPSFQELLSVLHDLAHHTTKVGSTALQRLTHALESSDWIELADLLEGDLPEWLSAVQTPSETSDQDVLL